MVKNCGRHYFHWLMKIDSGDLIDQVTHQIGEN